MRKVVLYTLMSLDGAVDDPDQYFLEWDPAMEDNMAKVIGSQDAVLLGRHMYDEWSLYWAPIRDHVFADFINPVKKYVITSTPLANNWDNAEAVTRPVGELLHDLRQQPGGDIGIHGSIELAHLLLEAGLVDELQLVVGPGIVPTGRRLFTASAGVRNLELLNAQSTPSGSLLLGYRVLGEG